MHTTTQNLTYTLPADAQYHLVRSANAILPAPPDPSPDAEARRNNALIARVAALHPGDSAESDLAGNFVLANELARDAILLSNKPDLPLKELLACRAQAASMMRQANAAIRELHRLQAARYKLEADREAYARAERTEHITTLLLAEGLTNPPPPVQLAPSSPEPAVSPDDLDPHTTETETPERQPIVLPVSSRDPAPRKHKTETPPRQPHDPEPPKLHPDHPEPELVGAWRLAHLFPTADAAD